MNLYLLTQKEVTGYDTFSDAVVCAKDEVTARNTHPGNGSWLGTVEWKENHWHTVDCVEGCVSNEWSERDFGSNSTWAPADKVTVKLIGVAREDLPAGVICASFHAG